MTVPKKKGYRRIVVADRPFKWRFAKHIVVVPDGLSGRQVLDVDFGWFDGWLYMNDRSNRPPEFSPTVATPAFVASAIDFALKNGWSTDVRGGRFVLKYTQEEGFHIPPAGTPNNSVQPTRASARG
jgi:hypothetical protein